MKALILKGKYTGKEVEVSQWCNDWFTLDPEKNEDLTENQKLEIMRKPFSPSSLAFTYHDFLTIRQHTNNGMLFVWFEQKECFGVFGSYEMTFKKRKLKLK